MANLMVMSQAVANSAGHLIAYGLTQYDAKGQFSVNH